MLLASRNPKSKLKSFSRGCGKLRATSIYFFRSGILVFGVEIGGVYWVSSTTMDKNAPKRRKLDHPPVQTKGIILESDNSSLDRTSALGSGETEISKTNGTPDVGMKNTNLARSTSRPMPSGDMYNSDLFQIQIGELLSTVQPSHDRHVATIEKILRKLKQVIEGIAPREALPVHIPTYLDTRFD